MPQKRTRSSKAQRRSSLAKFSNDIWQNILFQTNLQDAKSLAQAAPALRPFIHGHVNGTIKRVFTNLGLNAAFVLEVLESTGSVVSGSTILAILNPWTFKPNDLDLYVPHSAVNKVITLFVDNYGVTIFSPKDVQGTDYGSLPDVQDVVTLRKDSIHINIIVSRSDNPLLPIFNFHSTVVMNFMTSTSIFCAYPELTFDYRNLVNMNIVGTWGGLGDKVEGTIAKYIRRGYDFSAFVTDWPEFNTHLCGSHPACPSTLRFVTDGHGFQYWLHGMTDHEIGNVHDIEGEIKFGWKLDN
ncbi:hypothetical protein DXG01_011031 [Tephrocybe rancida]|nr:hypothetical protein DXG01_011031 [Tephrocybe rancida]